MTEGLQIGFVARETGLTVDAIRFYEKSGLLKRPARSEGGFRLFRQKDLEDLRFVRNAQALGFSLGEVRELLLLQSESIGSCGHVREMLDSKLVSVREKIAELRKLETGLSESLRKCRWELRNSGSPSEKSCPVLDEISGFRRTRRTER
ncbi:MAG: heavy metal-responsive transcriptional regulator [Acidobacteria bacterium]|nr:heavy metal-responsive transcriptional regulator [Acidobacteriota bacterium]